MFNSIEDFRHEVSDVDKQLRGTLNIGIIDNTITNMDSPLPSAISRFNQRASDVQIQIEVKPPLELEQSVLHGRMHAAIGPYPVHISGLDYRPIFKEKKLLYCSNNHPFASLAGLSAKTIRSTRIVARGYMHAADLKVLGVSSAPALFDNVEA